MVGECFPANLADWMVELDDDLERLKRDLETVMKHKTKLYHQLHRVLTNHENAFIGGTKEDDAYVGRTRADRRTNHSFSTLASKPPD